jgi:hypothetical protein
MLTLKTVNKKLKDLGYDVELVKGEDYFYFCGPSIDLRQSTSVMVYRLNQLSLDQWIDELKFILGEIN